LASEGRGTPKTTQELKFFLRMLLLHCLTCSSLKHSPTEITQMSCLHVFFCGPSESNSLYWEHMDNVLLAMKRSQQRVAHQDCFRNNKLWNNYIHCKQKGTRVTEQNSKTKTKHLPNIHAQERTSGEKSGLQMHQSSSPHKHGTLLGTPHISRPQQPLYMH